eukprot:gene11484-13573_t
MFSINNDDSDEDGDERASGKVIEGTYTESEAKAELETFKGVRRIQVSLVVNSQCEDWGAFHAKYTNLWAGKEVLETMVKMQRNPTAMDKLPTHIATVRIEDEEFHPKWYVMKASLDSMIDVPVTNYTLIFLDCQYELDTEKASSKTDKALTPKMLELFIENIYVNTKERLNNIEAGLVAYHCNREKGDPTRGRQDWQDDFDEDEWQNEYDDLVMFISIQNEYEDLFRKALCGRQKNKKVHGPMNLFGCGGPC